MDATSLFEEIRLLPVVTIPSAAQAVPLAEALLAAGIQSMEITLRTAAALDAISAVARDVPDMLVGAGSIRRPKDFGRVQAAGARFAVSPGTTPALLDAVPMPFVPGAATPSDMLKLLELGYRTVKVFPAGLLGGPGYLRAVGAPLPDLSFCPSGGVNEDNAREYLALPSVNLVSGSWFLNAEALAAGAYDEISRAAARALEAVNDTDQP